MRYAVIGDVHGNIRALEAVLEALSAASFDSLLFLGDLVGYGAEPNECVELLRSQENLVAIAGNHDRQVTGPKDVRMRPEAALALDWTREQLSQDNLNYLTNLPLVEFADDNIVLVHGSVKSPDAYIMRREDFDEARVDFQKIFSGRQILFFGHTHLPVLAGGQSIVSRMQAARAFKLDSTDIYLINPGSVGQPRDRCPMASCGLFDSEKWTMSFLRIPYDNEGASEAILKAGLPEKFATRLSQGI